MLRRALRQLLQLAAVLAVLALVCWPLALARLAR